jgi:hypothetical protein
VEPLGGTVAAVDGDSGVLYWGAPEAWNAPLRAGAIEADGRFTWVGSSDLCGSSILHEGNPLVAVNGWLLAAGSTSGYVTGTVCSYEGPQLTPRADLGLNVSVTAAVAVVPRTGLPLASDLAGSGTAPLVAMQLAGPKGGGPYEVRLFKMDGEGGLQPLDTIGGKGHLLFHPSGRFLYLSSTSGLMVFAINAQSRLELVQALVGGEGPMAVTLPS